MGEYLILSPTRSPQCSQSGISTFRAAPQKGQTSFSVSSMPAGRSVWHALHLAREFSTPLSRPHLHSQVPME